jgi:hypothetical protein
MFLLLLNLSLFGRTHRMTSTASASRHLLRRGVGRTSPGRRPRRALHPQPHPPGGDQAAHLSTLPTSNRSIANRYCRRVAYWKKLDRFLLAPASDAPCRTDQLVVVHLGVESHGVARLLLTGCVRKVLGGAFGRGPQSAVVAEEDGASMELEGVPI